MHLITNSLACLSWNVQLISNGNLIVVHQVSTKRSDHVHRTTTMPTLCSIYATFYDDMSFRL